MKRGINAKQLPKLVIQFCFWFKVNGILMQLQYGLDQRLNLDFTNKKKKKKKKRRGRRRIRRRAMTTASYLGRLEDIVDSYITIPLRLFIVQW